MTHPTSSQADHANTLRTYFDGVGYERWSAIYGGEPVSRVRQTVREGHALMLEQALSWVTESYQSGDALDAGCGTGLFSLMLAEAGLNVTAVDIAPKMAAATTAAAEQAGLSTHVTARAGAIDEIDGQYDLVACFDVLVHYPAELFVPLCTHLAERTEDTLLLTYAPYNRFLAFLHWVGGHFPKGQRRTEIQMIRDDVVRETLQQAGLHVTRTANISRGFYHITLLEAKRPRG